MGIRHESSKHAGDGLTCPTSPFLRISGGWPEIGGPGRRHGVTDRDYSVTVDGYASMTTTWSGTARRLLLGFGAMVAIFGLASWVALSGLQQTQDAVARMKVAEEGVRVALELASAVRDQYAHQAHTIIIGDESHLGFYTEAAAARARADAASCAQQLDLAGGSRRGGRHRAGQRRARRHLPRGHRAGGGPRRPGLRPGGARPGPARGDPHPGPRRPAGGPLRGLHRRGPRRGGRRWSGAPSRWILALLLGAPLLAGGGEPLHRPLHRPPHRAAAGGRGPARRRAARHPHRRGHARRVRGAGPPVQRHDRLARGAPGPAGAEREAGRHRPARRRRGPRDQQPAGGDPGLRAAAPEAGPSGPLADDLEVIEDEALRAQDIVEGLLDLSRPLPAGREPRGPARALRRGGGAAPRGPAARRRPPSGGGRRDGAGHPGQAAPGARQPGAQRRRGGRPGRPGHGAGGGGARPASGSRCEDTGPGLDDRPRRPASSSRSSPPRTRGTGLGLAVSRAIARAHGGDVDRRDPRPAAGPGSRSVFPRGPAGEAP